MTERSSLDPSYENDAGPEPVHTAFLEASRLHSTAAAIVCDQETISYLALTQAEAQVAQRLSELGVRAGDLVAICLPRSEYLPLAILAVLRRGAAYLLLDPTLPDGTLRRQLATIGPVVIITLGSQLVRVADVGDARLLCIDLLADEGYDVDAAGIPVAVESGHLACVVRAVSGAGPNGLIRYDQRALARAKRSWAQVYRIGPCDRVLQTDSLSLQAFTSAWINALCSGATLIMTRRRFEPGQGTHQLLDFLDAQRVSVLDCDVQLARSLLAELRKYSRRPVSLRLLLVSGERWYLDEHVALQSELGSSVRVLNVFSLAGAGFGCCYLELADLPSTMHSTGSVARTLSIVGRPFPGVEIQIDERSVRGDRIGEICIGRGNVGRTDSTQLWCRSGDLGRLRSDGLLEYVGRKDAGVGSLSALEVARAEAALRAHPDVLIALIAASEPKSMSARLRRVSWRSAGRKVEVDVYIEPVADRFVALHEVLAAAETTLNRNVEPKRLLRLPPESYTRSHPLQKRRLPRAPMDTRSRKRQDGKLPDLFAARFAAAPFGRALTVCVVSCLGAALGTSLIWPGSTDTSHVPLRWARVFHLLYLFEYVSFGLGVSYLFFGYPRLARLGRPSAITQSTHIAIAWGLISWWPQDNMYRMSEATDWPRQALLVCLFNISLMVCATIIANFAVAAVGQSDGVDDDDDAESDP